MFVTAHYKNGENRAEIENLCRLVREAGFEDVCFIRDVENYQNVFSDPQALMQRAKLEIRACDALLIDLSSASTGRAIEAGIAYGANKKIVILMKKGTELRDTVVGIADKIIEYIELADIVQPLKEFLQNGFDENNP